MSKNPFQNGILASLYIFLVVWIMTFAGKMADQPDSFLAPVAVISVFTLSAAVMGYLFCLQPLQMFLEGKKKQAVNLFLQTVAVFGGLTLIILVLLFSGIIH